VARWPEPHQPEGWEGSRLADFALVQEIVRSIRNLRAEKNVSPARRLAATIAAGDKTGLLKEQSSTIAALAGLDHSQLSILSSLKNKPEGSAVLVLGGVEIYLPVAGMVDVDAERARLEKELAVTESQIERLEKLLGGDFADKAPAPVIAKEREKLAAFKETAAKIRVQLS
jgi:valyl-tRNA synthetase